MRRSSSVCCRSTCLVLLVVGDVARDLRDADDRAGGRLDRGNAERDLDRGGRPCAGVPFRCARCVSPQPIRRSVSCTSGSRSVGTSSVMFLPAASAAEYPYSRSAAEFQPVMVPSSDVVMMASLEDFDRGAEQPLALGMMVARRDGAAMLLNLLLKRDGLRIDLPDRLRKRARQHAGLAASIDRNGDLALSGHPLNGFGQPDDRPGQRPRDQQRQHRRDNTAIGSDQKRGVPDARRRRHDHGVRGCFDDADPFGAGQKGRGESHPVGPGSMIRHEVGDALVLSRPATPDSGSRLSSC